jgi:hypothetical protein
MKQKDVFNKALQKGHASQNMLIWAKKGVRSHWKLQTIIGGWLVHELGALSLELKIKCDFNSFTWMNMFIEELFHMDECHFCMHEFQLWFCLNKQIIGWNSSMIGKQINSKLFISIWGHFLSTY